MIGTAAHSIPLSARVSAPASAKAGQAAHVRRRVGLEAGMALERLGHAIEYLTDELVNDGPFPEARKARIEAIELLMDLNRRIYLSCPEIPSLRDRLAMLFHPLF